MKFHQMKLHLLVVFVGALSITSFSQASPTKLSDLGWLAGCWEMNDQKRGMQITEMWMKPTGDAMIGAGRTLKAGKLADFEFLRIIETVDGLAYVSRPSGNKDDTSFPLRSSAANSVIFENPAHDFPQRILYNRDGAKLTARIEGTVNGKVRGVDFGYARVACE